MADPVFLPQWSVVSGRRSAVGCCSRGHFAIGPVCPSNGRRAYTVIELVLVLTLSAIVMGMAFPRGLLILDRMSVHSAAADVAATLHSARSLALSGRTAVAVDVNGAAGTLRVRCGPTVVLTRNIGATHGVQVEQSRDSLAFGPLGLGRGAANLSIVVRRRAAAETVFVSRLGRIRHG